MIGLGGGFIVVPVLTFFGFSLKLALMSIPGTIIGAYISDDVSPPVFKSLFAMVLVTSGAYIYLRRKMESREHNLSKQLMVFAAGASFFAGIVSSLFGIGGGSVFVPRMVG